MSQSSKDFRPPNVNFGAWRSPYHRRENNACDAVTVRCSLAPPPVSTEKLGAVGDEKSRSRVLVPDIEMHVKEMISLSPDTCNFLYIEEYFHKFFEISDFP